MRWAAILAFGLMIPAQALACEANWRFVQVALGAAGLQLSDAPQGSESLAGTACRVSGPELTVRGDTQLAARSVTWRVSPRKAQAQTILIDVELRGLTLTPGQNDPMAAHISREFGLERPADLFVTLTSSEQTGRIELRTRSSSPRPSIWLDALLTGTGSPSDAAWWAGLETARFSEIQARLRADGLAERIVLALSALDRLRGDGAPGPRLEALRNLVQRDIDRLPTETVDPVSRAALSDALADTPGGRGTFDAMIRWTEPQSAWNTAIGLATGRVAGQPQVSLSYDR